MTGKHTGNLTKEEANKIKKELNGRVELTNVHTVCGRGDGPNCYYVEADYNMGWISGVLVINNYTSGYEDEG